MLPAQALPFRNEARWRSSSTISEELVLEKLNLWSRNFLKRTISSGCVSNMVARQIYKEVDEFLKFPCHATLHRISNKRSIKHYNLDNTRLLKTSFCSSNFSDKGLLALAVEDFNNCQAIHREELKQLERWVIENKLDELKFARQKSTYCYFSAAATIFSPELCDARMWWAKNGVLATVVDDFFDVGGSMQELKNLITLVEKWNVDITADCCSENVQIIFSALKSTILDLGEKALAWQERSVTSHLIEIWLDLLNSMLKEAEWIRDTSVPTMDEYMTNAYVSFGAGPGVLAALYLVGPKLSEEIVRHSEYHSLFKLMGTVGRLYNDIQNLQRDSEAGKLNALSLLMIHGGDAMTKAAAIRELRSLIENHKRELLRTVLQRKGSVVPKACKDLFWNMTKVVIQFYEKDDGFVSNEMIGLAKSIIYEPLPSISSK